MRLRSVHDRGVGLEMLDYGEEVRISPVGLETFHLVQIPLRGRARMSVGAETVCSSPAVATVPPIDRDFSLTWERRTPHLIVYVQRERLLAALECVYGPVGSTELRLASQLALDTEQGRSFLRAVFELHDAFELTGAGASYAQALAADLMLARLLAAVEHSVGRSLMTRVVPSVRGTGRGDHLYRRFLDWAESGVEAQRSVLEIARELGVPLRTLQDHVQDASGSTPSAILRDVRFRRARQLLLEADPSRETVTTIAVRCGFGHLGRFSVEYRSRYGESPAESLRRP